MIDQLKLNKIINVAVLAISLLVIGLSTLSKIDQFIDYKKTELREKAVDNCIKASLVETEQEIEDGKTQKIMEPSRGIYSFCLQDKGFETNIK